MENMETAVEKKRRLREKLFSTQIKDIQRVFERLKKQDKYGGSERNRTAVQGFAGPYITTLPPSLI